MKPTRSTVLVAAAAALGLVLGGTTTAVAVSSMKKTVKVCTTSSGVVRSADADGSCPKKTTKRAIAVRGQRGARGPRGARGATGPRGPGAVSLVRTLTSGSNVEWPTPIGPVWTYCNGTATYAVGVLPPSGSNRVVQGTAWTSESTTPQRFSSIEGTGSYNWTARRHLSLDLQITDLETKKSAALDLTLYWSPERNACVLAAQVTPTG